MPARSPSRGREPAPALEPVAHGAPQLSRGRREAHELLPASSAVARQEEAHFLCRTARRRSGPSKGFTRPREAANRTTPSPRVMLAELRVGHLVDQALRVARRRRRAASTRGNQSGGAIRPVLFEDQSQYSGAARRQASGQIAERATAPAPPVLWSITVLPSNITASVRPAPASRARDRATLRTREPPAAQSRITWSFAARSSKKCPESRRSSARRGEHLAPRPARATRSIRSASSALRSHRARTSEVRANASALAAEEGRDERCAGSSTKNTAASPRCRSCGACTRRRDLHEQRGEREDSCHRAIRAGVAALRRGRSHVERPRAEHAHRVVAMP